MIYMLKILIIKYDSANGLKITENQLFFNKVLFSDEIIFKSDDRALTDKLTKALTVITCINLLKAMDAYMRLAKVIGKDYRHTYAFVNLFDFSYTAHNYQCIRWIYVHSLTATINKKKINVHLYHYLLQCC